MAGLEDALARLREMPVATPVEEAVTDPLQFQHLTLVEDTDLDREIVLAEISKREAQRGGTPLLLLGQRFGVLAGRPAFDPEHLPIGPHALCRVLRDAGETLHMTLDSQLLLYRVFERQVLDRYGELVERLNVLLTHEGVLPYWSTCRTGHARRARAATAAVPPARSASAPDRLAWLDSAVGMERRPDGRAGRAPAPARGDDAARDEAAAEAEQPTTAEMPEQAVFAALQNMLSDRRGDQPGGSDRPPA
ncbi:DUF1631 family protein [Pseudoxanthomonas sp. NC8]|nr:DUF1631 family protein [Pseudoxanthomonas sp. NC8]